MKHVLCFGDSNTFGYDAESDGRFPDEIRWTGVVQALLGNEYRIIEEGMGGRTAIQDDPVENLMSGKHYLPPCLESHWPLDLVIIMLGTNDLKTRFGMLSAKEIAGGVETLARMTREFFEQKKMRVPKLLIISPIRIGERFEENPYSVNMGGREAIRRSAEFARYYRDMAERQGCHFLDAAQAADAGETDWMHLDENGHRKLGEAVYRKICEIYMQK